MSGRDIYILLRRRTGRCTANCPASTAENPSRHERPKDLLSAGIYSNARDVIRSQNLVVDVVSSTPNCLDEPSSICPVARGCRLKATEPASRPCADLRYPSSTSWWRAKFGIPVGDDKMAFSFIDLDAGRKLRSVILRLR